METKGGRMKNLLVREFHGTRFLGRKNQGEARRSIDRRIEPHLLSWLAGVWPGGRNFFQGIVIVHGLMRHG